MPRRRLIWQIFPTYLFVLLPTLGAAALVASHSLRSFYLEHTTSELEARARLMLGDASKLSASRQPGALDRFCKEAGAASSSRVTIISPSGEVLGDTDEDLLRMENHAGRPEIVEALASGRGASTRRSPPVDQEMVYLALRLEAQGAIQGVLRVAKPLTAIDSAMHAIYRRIAWGGLLVLGLAAGLSWWLARRLSRPLEEMKAGATRIAGGELEFRCEISASEEVGGLALAMNRMAEQLHDRITAEIKQRNEMEAVLSSMSEGVFAVDLDEQIIKLNAAAARFFELDPRAALGRSVQEAVRNAELQRFIRQTLTGEAPKEGAISLLGESGRQLQAHGNVLRDAGGQAIGALIVLNDLTRLRQLESVRKDFVANVSHELKTPITSIKGFVETLQAGALQDREEAQRFLGIIARQADRLNAIIEDLLTLAKIEQGEERGALDLADTELEVILRSAVQSCEVKAVEREIRMEIACAPGLRAPVNAPLLEQALVNLLDNAIKYSEPGSRVDVAAEARNGGEVVLSVRDHGCGIEKEYLDRIFERFYRVDKARSRKLGGTGLGLAIVKHIAQAHGGRVSVESIPGKGSLFAIHLQV